MYLPLWMTLTQRQGRTHLLFLSCVCVFIGDCQVISGTWQKHSVACTRSLCGIFEALCGDNNHRAINYTFVNSSVDFVLVSRSQQCWGKESRK